MPPALLQVSQRGMVKMLLADSSPRGLQEISERMPKRIEDALDFPVLSDVIAVTDKKLVVKYVHFELIKLAGLLSVGGNLTDNQAAFIAEELVDLFKHETLADFVLCFRRGAIGQYNIQGEKDIFRFDGIVLRRWMEKYLDEKYQVIENENKKRRETEAQDSPILNNPEFQRRILEGLKSEAEPWDSAKENEYQRFKLQYLQERRRKMEQQAQQQTKQEDVPSDQSIQ